MASNDDLRRAVKDNPHDWGRMLVHADWLEEHGERDLAHCYRWMAQRHGSLAPAQA